MKQWMQKLFKNFICFINKGIVFCLNKKKIIFPLFGIGLFFLLACMILFSATHSIVNKKLKVLCQRVEMKTGIFVQYGNVEINPFTVLTGGTGKVTIHDISAYLGQKQLPFLTLSEVKIKGKPGCWFSCIRIKDVIIRDFTVRWSMDMLSSGAEYIKLLSSFVPGQKTEPVGSKENGMHSSYIIPADQVMFTVENGSIYFARKNTDLPGSVPVLSRCRMSGTLHRKEQKISGQCTGSGFSGPGLSNPGESGPGNVTGSFLISPYYQTVSLHCTRFILKPLVPLFHHSIKPDSSSAIDARISFHKYFSDPHIHVDVKGYINHIVLESTRLASQPVRFVSCGARGRCRINVENRTIKTDKVLLITRRVPFYIRNATIRLPGDKPFFSSMTFETDHLALQDIIDSLPGELLPHIKDTRVNGFMDISATLILDLENIKNTLLSVKGGISSFKMIQPPSVCDVRKIDSLEYVYTVSTKESEEISFILGPENEEFVPLDDVGWYIIEAVLTCEDGNFFIHNGFALNHINGAIRQNLKSKRFIRGGSTVSMQLIKNLFLSGEKTVSRKCEEIMLTWWMEKEINKNRLLEIYLNIVEWGPGIFGIGPAAEHYFQCKPDELSCIQATWLANILVNPSLFYYMKTNRKIDDKMRFLIKYAMREMKKHGGITEEEFRKAEKDNYEVYFPDVTDDEPGEIESEEDENIVKHPDKVLPS